MTSAGSRVRRITHTAAQTSNLSPAYAPDGKRIVFYGNSTGHSELVDITATGNHLRQLANTGATTNNEDPSWQPILG